jgi:hypothetical protein
VARKVSWQLVPAAIYSEVHGQIQCGIDLPPNQPREAGSLSSASLLASTLHWRAWCDWCLPSERVQMVASALPALFSCGELHLS